MNNYINVTECRLCKSPDFAIKWEIGKIALANSYLDKLDVNELKIPLTVLQCNDCGHIFLKETVNPEILFSNYLYSSCDSPALVAHFKEFASTVIKQLNLDDFSQVLEIGSNTNPLLKAFDEKGIGASTALIGVEPASNLCALSNLEGRFKIYNTFFNLTTAKSIRHKHGTMNLIACNNTFAHIDRLDSVVDGIKYLLADDGNFILENAYVLDTLKGLYFDQIYHWTKFMGNIYSIIQS